jgi:formylglycine-generating enzyme required for sulfatase activity
LRADIENPYIAGNPITGVEMFFGREDVFDWIQQTLPGKHRDNVIVLYGQRRTGKTSLLHQLGRHLAPRYLCIFIDLHGLALQGLDGFLLELAQAITRGLRKDYQIELPRLDRQIFLADARQSFETAFLDTVWAAIGNRHLLLMLDEAVRLEEQIRTGKLEPDVFQYLRHLMQHSPRLNFLFSLGSGLEEMEKEYAFLFNTSLYKKISFLDRHAAVELITQPTTDVYKVSPQAIELIWQITSGHPYFTQLICHSMFNHAVNDGIDLVQPAQVESVLDEAVERGSAVLKYVWEQSTQAEKAILAGMAATLRNPNRPASDARIRWNLTRQGIAIPQVEYPKAIKSLVAREVIVQEGKKLGYKFTVDLQRLWVAKHRHIEWVKEELPSEWFIHEGQRARVLSRLRLLLTEWGVLSLLIPLLLVLGFLAYYLYPTLYQGATSETSPPDNPTFSIASVVPDKTVAISTNHTNTPQPTSTPEPTATSTNAPTQAPTIISTPKPTLGIGSTLKWDKDGMTMVYIPEGEFLMGPSSTDPNVWIDEHPQHTVALDAYWIDQTEVTNAQYALCVAAGVCVTPEKTVSFSGRDYYGNSTYGDYPVIYVSWEDADRYCNWAGRRLPSEAEWEKAGRGEYPSDRIYPWGNQLPNCERANYRGCSTDTEPVGAYSDGVSPYGVFNMIGNVWEWVNDWYVSDYYLESPDINPPGPTSGTNKALRGGGWLSQDLSTLRVSNRSYAIINGRDRADVGFRCAVSAD